jgi:ABC-type glycerol-3-phosphate transport system substrate-binding protein
MKLRLLSPILFLLFGVAATHAQQKTVTIATVNNPAMIELKKLSTKFEQANPEIRLNWVVLSENVLRERVTTDVTQRSGQFDLVFIGLYETRYLPSWGCCSRSKMFLTAMTSTMCSSHSVMDFPTMESSTHFLSMERVQ